MSAPATNGWGGVFWKVLENEREVDYFGQCSVGCFRVSRRAWRCYLETNSMSGIDKNSQITRKQRLEEKIYAGEI